jgi:hypothetical protein
MPRGDYVTASIQGTTLTVVNHSVNEEASLDFSAVDPAQVGGSSMVYKTVADNEGNYYYLMYIQGEFLGLQKMDGGTDEPTGLPVFMFDKEELTTADLKGRAFNFIQLTAADAGSAWEAGAVGFDTDSAGTLYGAAAASNGTIYETTNNEGQRITLDNTEPYEDGALVMWETTVGNWSDANTFTGTASGPIVIDFGIDNGGGGGFAMEQADFDNLTAAEWFDTIAGSYFLIHYDDSNSGVNYMRLDISQKSDMNGTMDVTSMDGTAVSGSPFTIAPLNATAQSQLNSNASFASADSAVVQEAYQAEGVYSIVGSSDFIAFDPDGNFLGFVGGGEGEDVHFGFGIKDPNWQ